MRLAELWSVSSKRGSSPSSRSRAAKPACSPWPLVTVFGFIADPATHIFLKPNVTKIAAKIRYAFDYRSRPNWETYRSYLDFAETIRRDNRSIKSLRPRDMIDLQSFIWVQGFGEYPE